MAHIEGEIIISRPVEYVFDFVADERNEPHYNPIMIKVEQITNGPIGVGTQFEATAKSMGQPVEMTTEVTGYERPRRIRLKTHMAAMEIEGSLSFDAIPEGTRMRWSWEVEPRGVYRLMGPIIAQLGGRQEARIWAGLKDFLEHHQALNPPPSSHASARASSVEESA